MKKAVLAIIFALAMWRLPAQQALLALSPNPVEVDDVIDTSDPFFEIVGYATLTNTSNAPISVRWQRQLPSNFPMGWEVLVCDNSQCYPPFVSSNVMPDLGLNQPIVLAPGATSNLDVHLRPNQFPGAGSVRIQFFAGNDTTVLATGIYNFSVVLSSARNTQQALEVKVFPNPASEYFQLSAGSKVSRVVINNTLGRQVRSYDVFDGRRYYTLAGLPDGMYLVSLYDARGLIKTVRLIKRSLRP